jgi:hypothetical protein
MGNDTSSDTAKPWQIAFSSEHIKGQPPSRKDYENIGRIMFFWGQIEALLATAVVVTKGMDGSEAEVPKIEYEGFKNHIIFLKAHAVLKFESEIVDCLAKLEEFIDEHRYDRNVLAHGHYLSRGADKFVHLRSRDKTVEFIQLQELADGADKAARIARHLLSLYGEQAAHLWK